MDSSTTAPTASASARASTQASSAVRPGLSESRTHTTGGDKIVARQVAGTLSDDAFQKILEEGRHISGLLAHPLAGVKKLLNLLIPSLGHIDGHDVVVDAMSNDLAVTALGYTPRADAGGYARHLSPETCLRTCGRV